METLDIQVDDRTADGRGNARRLRRSGKIPGILYGPKTQPVPLALDTKDFYRRVAGLAGSHLVRMKSDSTALADKVALVKDIQYHPITGDVIHADFYEVDLTEKIQVRVPLHFVGKAAGVVRGGILQPVVREIEVECLPLDIPEFFNVEVSSLDIGDSVHIEELAMPEGVAAIYSSDFALVTVVPPTVEEAPTPAVEPIEGVPTEPTEGAEEKPEEEKEEAES